MTAFFERETKEFHPVTVKRNGEPITTGLEFAITAGNTRPAAWTPAVTIGDQTGVMVDNLTPGTYTVWARITADPELAVVDTGTIRVR